MIEFLAKWREWLAGLRRRADLGIHVTTDLSPLFSLEQFRKATGLSTEKAQDWYMHVLSACTEFDISTSARIAAFLAQVGHESGGFIHTRELWGPTPVQQRYEGRADLGNVQPGDGF